MEALQLRNPNIKCDWIDSTKELLDKIENENYHFIVVEGKVLQNKKVRKYFGFNNSFRI